PAGEIDLPVRVDRPPRAGDGTDPEVEVELRLELPRLLGQLLQQCTPDDPRSDDPDRERLWRQVEAAVDGAQRSTRVRLVDHDGDVSFRRALRDCADVDASPTERSEELPRDPRLTRHPVSNNG